MLQTMTFNGSRVINAEASFFRYESGSAGGASDSIKLRADGQDLGIYFPGDSVELPDRKVMWEIVPTSAACAGVVRLGIGRVQSARLVGVVQVVDTRSIRTRAAQAYMWRFTGIAAAGQYPTCTLSNPAGSGRRIVINQMIVGLSMAGIISVGHSNGAVVGAANAVPRNKLAQGAPSVAVVNASSTVGIGGGVSVSSFVSLFSNAQSLVVPLAEPIIVRPGEFFGIQGEAQAATMTGGLEYYEEADD